MARAWDSSPILRVPVRVPEGGTNKTTFALILYSR